MTIIRYEIREVEHSMDDGSVLKMKTAFTLEGHYIGDPETAAYLCDQKGIAPEPRGEPNPDANAGLGCTCSIGFCEKEQKWYGWSHRAIYGFGIGSTVTKGDCGYEADTPEGLIDSHSDFYADISAECAAQKRAECEILPDRSGIRILHTPVMVPMIESIADLPEALGDEAPDLEEVDVMPGFSIVKCGCGEWTAQTLDDAKQMAEDFAESIS